MEILDASQALPMRGRGAPPKYDWDTWYKHGQTGMITKGEDFECDVQVMRQQMYQKAKALGGKVSTEVRHLLNDKTVIVFTFMRVEQFIDEDLGEIERGD
jgi:hypothetical protein